VSLSGITCDKREGRSWDKKVALDNMDGGWFESYPGSVQQVGIFDSVQIYNQF
jgi:hypothetical protein